MSKKPTAASKAALKAAAPVPETAKAAIEAVVAETPAAEAATSVEAILIHDELLDVARTKDAKFADQGGKEDDKTYILRLITIISEVEDDVFNGMQQKSQDWYNSAASNESEGKLVEMPEGFVSKFGAKKPAAEKAPKVAAEKAPKAAKAPPAPREPKTDGIVARGRALVLKNLDKSLADIMELAKTSGMADVKASTMAAVYTDTRATVNVAKSLGLWK